MKKLIVLLTILIAGLGITSQVHANSEEDKYVYFNDVENPSTIEEIQSHLTANDVLDGDITDTIKVKSDAYTGNETTLGDFVIIFSVTDSINQETMTAITVRNQDVTSPQIIIENESSLRIPLNSTWYTSKPGVKAIDSYDGDITNQMTIEGSVDTSTLGEYPLTYTVSDAAGNTTTKEIVIEVVDVTKPVMNGPTKIIKNSNYILASDFYLDYFTASDNIDGNITENITIKSNEYVGNANKKGTYNIVLSIKDSSLNEKTLTLTIEVKEDMIPLLIIDKYYMIVSNQSTLSDNTFVDILKDINDIPNDTYIFNSITNTYDPNASDPGIYNKKFELLGSTAQEHTRDLTIEVIDHEFDYIDASPSFIQNTLDFIKAWWWVAAIAVLMAVGIKKR